MDANASMSFHARARRSAAPGGDVVAWRRDQLRAAGFAPDRADRLAADPRRDLHALLELVDRGCPPRLAERILAPLDDDELRP